MVVVMMMAARRYDDAGNDPAIGIEWGIEHPLLSEKDASAPFLKEAEKRFPAYRG